MQTSLRWRLGFVAAFAMMFLALYPQLNSWHARGDQWNGAYAFFDTDEAAYSAYLQALIDGRARRNDPYTGRDHTPDAPQGESIFSIQVAPAYALAWVARLFNLSASTIFIILIAAVGAASALAIFRLIAEVTGDERVAATGALFALCLGTLANGQGAISAYTVLQVAYLYLPFLRRYVPAFPFPFYFVMFVFLWRALVSERRRAAYLSSALAGLCFAVLVYSYFYLWTTAIAQVACLAALWIAFKPERWRESIERFAVFFGLAILALVPYFILVARRAVTMDAVQALTHTRFPDLHQPPEIAGLITLVVLALAARRGRLSWRAPRVLFTASFAIVPFVVFNQQVLTGRSLQPLHYEEFVANYVALTGFVMAVAIVWQGRERATKISGKILLWIALAAFGWGFVEAKLATELFVSFNTPREMIWPAARRLGEIERQRDFQDVAQHGRGVALTYDLLQADTLPTTGPQAVLWAPHMHVFSGVTPEENRERFYQHLYYTGVDERVFRSALAAKNFYFLLAVYGWERANPILALYPKPITAEENEAETRLYMDYVASFDRERAARPRLSYLLLAADASQDLPNLDQWYERDQGERVGAFVLYRLRLKP